MQRDNSRVLFSLLHCCYLTSCLQVRVSLWKPGEIPKRTRCPWNSYFSEDMVNIWLRLPLPCPRASFLPSPLPSLILIPPFLPISHSLVFLPTLAVNPQIPSSPGSQTSSLSRHFPPGPLRSFSAHTSSRTSFLFLPSHVPCCATHLLRSPSVYRRAGMNKQHVPPPGLMPLDENVLWLHGKQ